MEKCALCSRMRQASAASTIPSTAGAKKASDHAFHVTIFGNTGMPMVPVEPLTGESCFLVMPYCNTACMNLFLRELSKQFPQDTILMCCDGAAWHKSGTLEVPENIVLFHIPPYTPEMNPIEQIWKEIRKRGFRNEVFATLEKVVDRLCDTICSLTHNTIFSITGRDWIVKALN